MAAAGAAGLLAGTAGAGNIVWTGQGANSNWSTTGNWSTSVAPANSISTDIAQLSGTVVTTNVDSPWSLAGLAFNNNAQAFTVSGSTLTLGASGIANNSIYAAQTINNNIVFGATGLITNSSSAVSTTNVISTQIMKPADTLVLAGTTLDNGGFLLTTTGAATRIDSQITGAGGLTVSTGFTTLTNSNNTFGGTLTIAGGSLMLNDIGALGGTGTIAVTTGASSLIYNNADAPISRAFSTSGNVLTVANIGTGTLTLTGGISGTVAPIFRGKGNITLNTTGISAGTGTLEKYESGTATINAASTFNQINVKGGTLAIKQTITQTSGSVNVGWFGANDASITMANTAAVLRLSDSGTLNTSGAYNVYGGGSLILDNGAVDNTNRIGNGAMTIRGGTLSLIGRNDGTTNTAETVGAVTLGTNYGTAVAGNGNVITVNRNGAASATLTLGGTPTRSGSLGTSVDYVAVGEDLGGTSKVMFSGGSTTAFLGPWATVTNGTSTDFAEYDATAGVRAMTAARVSAFGNNSSDQVLTTGDVQLSAGSYTANTAKLGGSLDVNGTTVTLASGGLIAATGTSSISDTAPVGGSGIRSNSSELFIYTPTSAATTISATLLENATGTNFIKTGAGTATLNPAGHTYTGQTIVGAGTLKAGGTNALPTATVLNVAPLGTFDLNGYDVQVGDLLGSGTLNLTGGKTLTVTNNTGSNTTARATAFTGILAGTGSITLNGTGTVGISGNSPNFAGTINVNKGQLQFDGNSAPDIFGQMTLNLGLDSNPVTLESRVGNTPTAFSSLATINIKGADVQIGPSIGTTTRTWTINSAITFDKGSNTTQTFRPATTSGGVVLNGLVTVKNDVTFAAGTVTNPVLSINKGIAQTTSVKFTNNMGTGAFTIQGDGFSGSGFTLTLTGTRGYTLNGILGTNTQTFLLGDGTSTGTITFGATSSRSTFDGGVTLQSGTLSASGIIGTGVSGTTPIVFAGPVGRGLLKVTGGVGTLNIGGTTLYNNVEINGGASNTFTFDDSSTTNGTTLRGVTSFKGTAALTLNFNDNNTDNIVSNAILYQDATFGGTAVLRVGIGNDGNARQVTFTGAGSKYVEGYTSGAGTTTFTSGNFSLGTLGGSGGTYILNGPSVTATSSSGTFSNGVTLNSGTLTFTNSSVGANVSGPLGTGTFTIVGGSITTDSGDRTIANPTIIAQTYDFPSRPNSTTLTFSGPVTISNTPTITQSSASGNGSTLKFQDLVLNSDITLGGLDKISFAPDLSVNRTVALTGAGAKTLTGTLRGTAGAELTLNSGTATVTAVAGTSSPTLKIDGAFAVMSSSGGASTFDGGVKLVSGTLQLDANSTPTSGAVTAGPLGTGTLRVLGGAIRTTSNSPGGTGLFTVANNYVVDTGTVDLQDQNGQNYTFSGTGEFKNNPTLSQSGQSVVTFSNVTLTSGATVASATGSGGFSNIVLNGLTLPGDRTLTFNGTTTKTVQGALAGNYVLTIAGTATNVVLSAVTGSGTQLRVNDANVTVNASSSASTVAGGVRVTSGKLIIGASSNGGFTQGPIGLGSLTLEGGTVTTGVNGGPYSVGNHAVLTGSGTTLFADRNGQDLIISGGLEVQGGASYTLSFDGGGQGSTRTFSGASTLAGDLSITGDGKNNFAGQFTVTGSRTISSTNTSNNAAQFSGGFTGTGGIAFAGAGTTYISGGTSDYPGATTVSGVSTLRTGAAANVLSSNSVYTVDGTLDLRGGNSGSPVSQTIGGLAGSGSVTNANGNSVGSELIIAPAAGTNTFSGTIQNANGLKLTKNGAGTQVLSTPNLYTLGTTVAAGTLVVSNTTGSATGTGNVTLTGGTLASGALGIITGTVIADPAAAAHSIAPGGDGTIGTLRVGGLGLNAATTLSFADIASSSTLDQIIDSGALTITGTANVAVPTTLSNGTYTLLTYTGSAPAGNFQLNGGAAPAGYTLTLDATSRKLNLAVVRTINATWIGADSGSGSGNWSDPNNWFNGHPISAGATANFVGNGIAAVNVDGGGQTLGHLVFDQSQGAVDYTLAGATLTLDAGGTSHASIAVAADPSTPAHQTISAPIALSSNLDVSVADGSQLTVGAIAANSKLMTKTDPGTLTLTASKTTLDGGLTIAGGKVELAPSVSPASKVLVTNALTMDPAAKLDLKNNALVVHDATALADVTAKLVSGYAGGAWNGNGIQTSSADSNHGLGVLTAAQAIANGHTATASSFDFNGETVSGTDVLVQHGWNGDLNMDGGVDYLDYGVIDNGYLSSGTTYAQGDLNHDGTINYLDYGLMDNAYLAQTAPHLAVAAASAALSSSAVPEPATIGLLGIGALGLLGRRRRMR